MIASNIDAAIAEIERLREVNKELVEALKPFADYAEILVDVNYVPDPCPIVADSSAANADPTPAMIEAGAKVIAGVAYGDFAKTLAEDCYRAMREAKDQK